MAHNDLHVHAPLASTASAVLHLQVPTLSQTLALSVIHLLSTDHRSASPLSTSLHTIRLSRLPPSFHPTVELRDVIQLEWRLLPWPSQLRDPAIAHQSSHCSSIISLFSSSLRFPDDDLDVSTVHPQLDSPFPAHDALQNPLHIFLPASVPV